MVWRHGAQIGGRRRRRRVLRGAFIGFGNVAAEGHLPGWQSCNDVRIVAATDALATRRDVFRTACPGARWYDSVDALLSGQPLDFVDICTPPGTHSALIEQALHAGLRLLCAKPLSTRLSAPQFLAAAAPRTGRAANAAH